MTALVLTALLFAGPDPRLVRLAPTTVTASKTPPAPLVPPKRKKKKPISPTTVMVPHIDGLPAAIDAEDSHTAEQLVAIYDALQAEYRALVDLKEAFNLHLRQKYGIAADDKVDFKGRGIMRRRR